MWNTEFRLKTGAERRRCRIKCSRYEYCAPRPPRIYCRADPLAIRLCTGPLSSKLLINRCRFFSSGRRFTAARKSSAGRKGVGVGKKGDGGRTRAINKHRGGGGKSVIPYRLCILERRLTIKEKFLLVLRFQPSPSFSPSFSRARSLSPSQIVRHPPNGGRRKTGRSLSRARRQGGVHGRGGRGQRGWPEET